MNGVTKWLQARMEIEIISFLIIPFLLIPLFIFTGCAVNSNMAGESDVNIEKDWPLGQGQLEHSIGNEQKLDIEIYDNTLELIGNEYTWEDLGLEESSGIWFIGQKEGPLGYSISAGVNEAGSPFFVDFFAYKTGLETMERDVRIRLIDIEHGMERQEVIVEEVVYVRVVRENQQIYGGDLPEKENTPYVFSVEILDEKGQVEDTLVSFLYVPIPEMNASLSMKQPVYKESDAEALLQLLNYGPTILFFGESYTIEKKVVDLWREVPLQRGFTDVGKLLLIDREYEQMIDIKQLSKGEYRVVKSISADGLDLSVVLAAEFVID